MRLRLIQLLAATTLATGLCRAQATITTVAGSNKCCNSADGGQAINTWLPSAGGIAFDRAGNLYIWEGSTSKVRKVDTAGVITTVAGNGTPGYNGDGGPATSAQLFSNGTVLGLAVDDRGNLYISDGQNHAVRKVDTTGKISTVAGSGVSGFSGDGGPATAAKLNYPAGIALDSAGNLYIADASNSRVRKVDTAGMITTVAGNGNVSYSGDGVQATATAVDRPEGVTVDGAGNLYIAETSDSRVRRVEPGGIIRTIAGQTKKTNGFSGDGGPATAATLSGPAGMAVDRAGNLYIADNGNSRIRKVDAAGVITTYAGINGNASTPIGDGGPPTSAFLGVPKDVAFDPAGNLYVAGSAGGVVRIRKITAAPTLSTTPASLSFAYTIGGDVPASQSFNVAMSGSAVSFTAAASTTSGPNWLSVSPSSGTTPATLNVSINPVGIPGGVYQGAITLTPSGSGIAPQGFAVALTVTGASAPVFTTGDVVNAMGHQSKLAPGALFLISGSGLGPASQTDGDGGTSIIFTPASGGDAIAAQVISSSAGQVSALLPSSITPGTYAVRVTYNTLTSAPQNVTVVARSFGIATTNGAGTGVAKAAFDADGSAVTLASSPAHPGDTLVLSGTGGGADPANDTGGSSGDQTDAGSFRVMLNGHQITPSYAGAVAGSPGMWQIRFTVPDDIEPGCFASVQVSAGGELGNAVTIPIAASGESACSDPQLTQDLLKVLDSGGTIAGGGFGISKVASTTSYIATPGAPVTTISANQEIVGGGIAVYTAAEYAAVFSGGVKIGPCIINDRTTSSILRNPAAPEGYLDAGPSLPLSGPGIAAGAALRVASTNPGPVYSLLLSNGTIVGGAYTLKGNGGKDLGPFSATVDFPANFTVVNWDSLNTIDRSVPLTIRWTGGLDQVYLIGSSSAVLGKDSANTSIVRTVSFTCQVPAAPGSYTIPSRVLSYLLPAGITAASLANGSATLVVESGTSQPFTVSLSSGGQAAWAGFSSVLGYSRNLSVQ